MSGPTLASSLGCAASHQRAPIKDGRLFRDISYSTSNHTSLVGQDSCGWTISSATCDISISTTWMRGGKLSFSSIFYLINISPCARNYFPVPRRVKHTRGPRKNRRREPPYPDDDEYRPDTGIRRRERTGLLGRRYGPHALTLNGTVPSHQRLRTPRLSCFTSEPGD